MRFTGTGRNLNRQLFRMSKRKVQCPSTKYKVEIRNTELKLMSNVQRRLKNVEGRYNVPACGRQAKYKVGIRIGIGVLVFKDLGTSYLVLGT